MLYRNILIWLNWNLSGVVILQYLLKIVSPLLYECRDRMFKMSLNSWTIVRGPVQMLVVLAYWAHSRFYPRNRGDNQWFVNFLLIFTHDDIYYQATSQCDTNILSLILWHYIDFTDVSVPSRFLRAMSHRRRMRHCSEKSIIEKQISDGTYIL